MGNNIAKPLTSLAQSNPKLLRKHLPTETFPNATIIDCLHACLFPHGQIPLALNSISKVSRGWQVLCDLHALIDYEDKQDVDGAKTEGPIHYQKLQVEQVLACLADIDQPEELLSILLHECN